jgi:uncharacterized protein YcnI
MRHGHRLWARSLTLSFSVSLTLAAAGVLALSSAAAADVTVTPSEATRGDAASVTFEVRNLRPGAHTTRVEVDLPAEHPVAEVYPMSHPDWAPKIIQHRSSRPLPGVHGTGLTTVTSAIIWQRAADASPPPPVERLRIELGPLPDADSFVFTVVQTYSDGTVQRWQGPSLTASGQRTGPGTVLTLTAPADSLDGASAAGSGHQQHGGRGESAVDPATAETEPEHTALDPIAIIAVVAVSVGLVLAVLLAVRGSTRRRAAASTPDPSESPKSTETPKSQDTQGSEDTPKSKETGSEETPESSGEQPTGALEDLSVTR